MPGFDVRSCFLCPKLSENRVQFKCSVDDGSSLHENVIVGCFLFFVSDHFFPMVNLIQPIGFFAHREPSQNIFLFTCFGYTDDGEHECHFLEIWLGHLENERFVELWIRHRTTDCRFALCHTFPAARQNLDFDARI